ncbi:hypothetical protein C0J52_19105 [Blattella germanica]|nr:hypothetical protein C0J52_19105 [Blattella germanica]
MTGWFVHMNLYIAGISTIKPWDIWKRYWSHHLLLEVTCMDFSHSLNLQLTPRAIASSHHKPFRKLFLAFSFKVRAALFSFFFLRYGSMFFVSSRYNLASSNVTIRCHLSPARCRSLSFLSFVNRSSKCFSFKLCHFYKCRISWMMSPTVRGDIPFLLAIRFWVSGFFLIPLDFTCLINVGVREG